MERLEKEFVVYNRLKEQFEKEKLRNLLKNLQKPSRPDVVPSTSITATGSADDQSNNTKPGVETNENDKQIRTA